MNEIYIVPKKEAVAWKLFISTMWQSHLTKSTQLCMQNFVTIAISFDLYAAYCVCMKFEQVRAVGSAEH